VVLNEYAYLWLKRDGTPTELTRPFYDAVLGPEATADERRQLHARFLAAVTEFWRASRTCFGILHVFGLAHSMPGCYTSDVFADVEELELDPHFLDAMRDAFAPVAVMIDDWQTGRTRSSRIEVPVVITNDTTSPFAGNVILTLAGEGTIVRLAGEPCRAAPWGQQRLFFKVQLPDKAGTYTMLATLETPGGRNVRSRREIRLE
jgi:hypothetical protein